MAITLFAVISATTSRKAYAIPTVKVTIINSIGLPKNNTVDKTEMEQMLFTSRHSDRCI